MTQSVPNSNVSKIRLNPNLTKAQLIELFSISPTSIKVIFTIDSTEVFLSKGMVAIQSGQVQLHDIYRALSAATNIPSNESVLFKAKAELVYEVDDYLINTSHHPTGIKGRVLSVGISLVGIPKETIETIQLLIDTFEHHLIGFECCVTSS